ncbi:hypothetical protein OL239_10975 [Arthrobacter sp. ATA002]|uniref:hypothetical protein n=1 Tax=Arthrobacter sp. ATA002 TaxID=2991715 RepID=UPI0022A76F8A|nr:hypothetical protein [Arthrobacter sp. ATA002]WAP50562.1 hypothetical protein OL239_10975 [Arthrobacter sp. ATA002]
MPWRQNAIKRLEDRLHRAADDGELPRNADPARLARYLNTVVFGISVQAANGSGAEELSGVVNVALLGWPR